MNWLMNEWRNEVANTIKTCASNSAGIGITFGRVAARTAGSFRGWGNSDVLCQTALHSPVPKAWAPSSFQPSCRSRDQRKHSMAMAPQACSVCLSHLHWDFTHAAVRCKGVSGPWGTI